MTEETPSDWLWDRTGTPDLEVERLELQLGRWRFRPGPGRIDRIHRAPRWTRLAVAAIAAGVLLLVWSPWSSGPPARSYVVHGSGAPARVASGDRLEAADGLQLEVDGLGTLRLERGARLRVEEAASDRHAFFLERGTAHASIEAEPRVFQIGTPAGLTVDLGCVYDVTVTDDGSTLLSVASGRVAFETEGRSVICPEGAACQAVPGIGPNAPIFGDARDAFRRAVRAIELDPTPDPEQVRAVGEEARKRDSLTLWHLARQAPAAELREAAYAVLLTMVPEEPAGGRALLAGDPGATEAWRAALEWMWF